MTITLRGNKSSSLTYTELDNNFIDLDTRTKLAWHNLSASVDTTGLANPPSKILYKSTIQLNAFGPSSVQELNAFFHMPKDFIQGTDIWPHGHIMTPTADTGVVRWGFTMMVANEFDVGGTSPTIDQKFGDPYTTYYETNITPDMQDAHVVVQSSTPFNIPALQGDSIILCRVFRDSTHVNDTYTGNIFLLFVDLYYQGGTFGSQSR
jgi:hypothetical protein